MKQIISIIITILIFIACQSENEKKYPEAQHLGKYHAQKLSEGKFSDIELQYILLEIRANETEIRSTINNNAADAYIKAFTDYIKSHNDSLARKIF